MGELLKRPIFLGVMIGVLLLILCIFIPIPIYDGIFHYDLKLVHIQTESKVALSYYFGIGLQKTIANGVFPSKFELKPIGYVLFVLIHVGLPALLAIRFKMSKARKAYAEDPANTGKIEKPADE